MGVKENCIASHLWKNPYSHLAYANAELGSDFLDVLLTTFGSFYLFPHFSIVFI